MYRLFETNHYWDRERKKLNSLKRQMSSETYAYQLWLLEKEYLELCENAKLNYNLKYMISLFLLDQCNQCLLNCNFQEDRPDLVYPVQKYQIFT